MTAVPLDGPWSTPPPEDRYADVPPPSAAREPVWTTWRPVDLTDVLRADHTPPTPSIGERSDGRGICYPGRSHTIVGQSEDGKSWAAQQIGVQELGRLHGVVYLDFEDDAHAVTHRMMTLGAPASWLVDRFAYVAPSEPITAAGGLRDLTAALHDLRPTLVVIDGVTEALSLHGLSTNDNDEIARFGRALIRPILATGAASLSLDHVTKNSETRGRYAIGGVHKLNAVTGVAFILENVSRFGQGLAGRSRLLIAKDRPGSLRAHALPGTGDRWWYADLTLDTGLPEPAEFIAPEQRVATATPFRPTVLMTKVSEALAGAPGPLTSNDIYNRVQGRRTDIAKAIAALVDDGHVAITDGPRGARHHTLTRPYPDPAGDTHD